MKTTQITLTAVAALLLALPLASSADNWGKKSKYRAKKEPTKPSDMLALDTGASAGAATLIRSRNGLQGRVMANVATAGDPIPCGGRV